MLKPGAFLGKPGCLVILSVGCKNKKNRGENKTKPKADPGIDIIRHKL
jgi:hypothetical protein